MARVVTTHDGLAVQTTNNTPTVGKLNVYNASSGALSCTLPLRAGQGEGVSFFVQKDPLDTSFNAVTFVCQGTDTFTDGSTSFALTRGGSYVVFQAVTVDGVDKWKKIHYGLPRFSSGLSVNIAEVNLNTSTTETNVISFPLPTGELQVGSTYRLRIRGTVQVQATSGTLTFRPYLGANVASQTFQMASQTGAAGPVGFDLSIDITVRTSGATGTYVASGWGRIEFGTAVILTSTSTATAVVDTTAATPTLKLTAQWATSSATNILKVVTATMERII